LKVRPPWLIPALVAVILFVGGVASNLVASDLQEIIRPYRKWVWVVFAIALVVAVVVAISDARRRDSAPVETAGAVETTRNVNASGERSVAAEKIEGSTLITGNENVVGNRIGGDNVAGDKITYINQTADSAVNALHQLRPPVGDFVGREREIETLINALRRGSHASINGMGGTGKTELALLVAQHIARDYLDAQFFINLQGTDAKSRPPEEAMAICIRAVLGPEAALPDDPDQLAQLYRSQLNDKRTLLLLDNAFDGAQVRPLLPPTGSVLLVTSRQAISLPGMTSLTLNPLTDNEAQKLLLEIAPRAEPAVQQICALCGYLPLAIRAAGSLLAVTADLDPVAYARQLKDERTRFERIGKEGVEIDVAASFNLSYERLAPEACRVFRLLSVFPGTFHSVAEEAVCADEGHAQLSDLVRRSLVLYDSNAKRYRLHDLARLFADSKLSDEERTAAHKRYAKHYRDVLAVANELYKEGGAELAQGLALFDIEWSNIQAAHSWVATPGVEADEDRIELGMTFPDAGVYVLNLRQHAREWIRWQEIALVAARQLKDRAHEGVALGNLGIAYRNLGENQRAIEFHEQSLTFARELGNRRDEGGVLGNLGIAYAELGETQQAIQFFEQALAIARELGDRRFEGAMLGNLGIAYTLLGKTQRAIEFSEQQLTIARELGDRRGEGQALGSLGSAYMKLGETQKAIKFLEQRLTIAREIGDRKGEGNGLWNLSLALAQLGDRVQAIQYAEQSFAIYEQIEDPYAADVRKVIAAWREEENQN
jgi:tetratricopeptide (TPR) repeat protein